MSACAVSVVAYAGERSVVAGTVGTARMESAYSVSVDRVCSQTRRRSIRRVAMRFARPRAGSPCSRFERHFAGLAYALGSVLVE